MLAQTQSTLSKELLQAVETARAAGELVLQLRSGFTEKIKSDGSIVTSADIASANLIRNRLQSAFPMDAVLTEEDEDDPARVQSRRCWIVDPIDGTTAYVSGSEDFDIYIALVEDGVPIVAVTHQPVTGKTVAAAAGGGVWLGDASSWQLAKLPVLQSPPVIVTRHWLGAPSNLDWVRELAAKIGAEAKRATTGISSRSFLSSGVDAIIGRSTSDKPISAKEWDVAPLDLIVREAGGWSSDLLGRPLGFNKLYPVFPTGLVLARTHALGERIIAAITK